MFFDDDFDPQEILKKIREFEAEERDSVNEPDHYTSGGIETIEFIKSKLSPEEFLGYCKGNVLKYLSRESLKGGKEDLEKAKVYLEWAIENYEKPVSKFVPIAKITVPIPDELKEMIRERFRNDL